MNRRLLEKKLRELGCKFSAHGGGHDRWISKSGMILYIPRHNDIKQFTAEGLIKQASK